MKKTKKTSQVTKDMAFSEVLQKYPDTANIFFKHGMACCGCPMAMSETVEQGCLAHGLDPDKIVAEINKKIKKK
jgi:hybrid cluster-associated redox disulfide protein